jgi:hypothetical protein
MATDSYFITDAKRHTVQCLLRQYVAGRRLSTNRMALGIDLAAEPSGSGPGRFPSHGLTPYF